MRRDYCFKPCTISGLLRHIENFHFRQVVGFTGSGGLSECQAGSQGFLVKSADLENKLLHYTLITRANEYFLKHIYFLFYNSLIHSPSPFFYHCDSRFLIACSLYWRKMNFLSSCVSSYFFSICHRQCISQ